MKSLVIVLIVVVVLVVFALMFINNIVVTVDITGINVDGFVSSLITSRPTVKVDASVTINNTNFFTIPLSGLYVEVYDEGALIARSVSPSGKFSIKSERFTTFVHSINVYISPILLEKIKQIKEGNPIKFKYKIRGKLFGIPVRFRNQYNSIT